MAEAKKSRKTRFVCVSDTHNSCPGGGFQLPKGDVLIHAGDLTNQGSFKELKKAVDWIEEADFEAKIVIAGNHDITLDSSFYDQYGLYFHNQDPQDTTQCQRLLENSSSIIYLKHEARQIKLSAPDGPQTSFKIFGSPYSPAKGMWAYGYKPEDATSLWNKIPLDSDIVVTHTPAKCHLDERSDRRAAGCEALRCMLWRVRPRLALCGHVHEGRGAEIVKWDLSSPNTKYKEAGISTWVDPGLGNKKTSLVDLTAKGGRNFENDGTSRNGDSLSKDNPSQSELADSGKDTITYPRSSTFTITECDNLSTIQTASVAPSTAVQKAISQVTTKLIAVPSGQAPPATHGQGGIPPSARCDLEALTGRLGRRETCIINAAIMASSWPHNRSGGKKFNKPIVVDIDLPVTVDE